MLVLSILFCFSLLCFYFSQKIELEFDLLTHQLLSGKVALLSFNFFPHLGSAPYFASLKVQFFFQVRCDI